MRVHRGGRGAYEGGGVGVALGILLAFCVLLSAEQPYAQETAAMFVITGTVYRGESVAEDGLTVAVTNVTSGMSDTTATGSGSVGSGQYAVTFADLMGSRAAAVGDEIEVQVYDADRVLLGSATYVVTSDDITAASATLDVVVEALHAVRPTTWGEIKDGSR